MMHPNMFPKDIVSVDIKSVKVKHDIKPTEVNDDVKLAEVNDVVNPGARLIVVKVDVHSQFTNKEYFIICEHMLQWVYREVSKFGFDIVIGR